MKKLLRFAAIAGLLAALPLASIGAPSLQQATDQGKNLGLQNKNEVGTSRINEETASQVPFFKPSPVQKDGFQGGFGDMVNIGVDRITQSKEYSGGNCDREGFDPAVEAQKSAGAAKWAAMTAAQRQQAIQSQSDYFDQECEGINFLAGEYQMRQKIEIPPDDSLQDWVPPAGDADGNGACTTQTTTIPPEFNTEYCYESMTIENRFCNENLAVQCQPPQGNCASEGVIRGSVSVSTGNYSYTFDGSQLVLRNSITQAWTQTWANFTFNLAGVDRIEEFRAIQIQSDNWVGIEVNGVYLGTHTRFFGGWRSTPWTIRMGSRVCTEFERGQCIKRSGTSPFSPCIEWEQICTGWTNYSSRVEYAEGQYRSAETGDSFTSAVNIDMRPYLREGANTIKMYVIDGGAPGNGQVWINARQRCLPQCSYNWSNNCAAFENVRVN